MAWEERNGREYYYRKVWHAGTCRSEYIGGGLMGQYAAILDDDAYGKAHTQRAALRKVQAEQDQVDRQVDELGELVRQYVTALMLASGYHTHKRQWRRKRE